VGGIDGDLAGLAPLHRHTAAARSTGPREGRGGRGGGGVVGVELGWTRVGVRAGAGRSGRSSSGRNPYIGEGWW
jgi:hypothetical protein